MKVLCVLFLLCGHVAVAIDYCLPTESCWPSKVEVLVFSNQMAGKNGIVLTPESNDWPKDTLTFNSAVAETPGMVVYVRSVETIRLALQFAYKHNIKISIVSSGHSFLGRCGAEGSMQISVHDMKGIDIDLDCEEHSLGCMTTQSGVQWGEAYQQAERVGRLVVGGSNPTVSVSGWTLGGGHSPLTRMYGLGVDNVLSYHLVTADLSEVWASNNGTTIAKIDGTVETTDDTALFFALRGGGSAFGVLVDLKVKMHQDTKVGQMVCQYNAFADGTPKTFDVIFKSFNDLFKKAPNTFSGYLLPSAGCAYNSRYLCGGTFLVSLLHFGENENSPDDDWLKMVAELPHKWTVAGLQGGCSLTEYPTFYQYELSIPNVTESTVYIGGSLLQEELYSDATVDTITDHLNQTYYKAKMNPYHNLQATAIWVGGAATDVPVNETAVHPGWRKALFSISSGVSWNETVIRDPSYLKKDIREFHADLERFSSGKYYNEAEDDMNPDQWKEEFWGMELYNKLMVIKRKWDPSNRFTCRQCLGSDWEPTAGSVVG